MADFREWYRQQLFEHERRTQRVPDEPGPTMGEAIVYAALAQMRTRLKSKKLLVGNPSEAFDAFCRRHRIG